MLFHTQAVQVRPAQESDRLPLSHLFQFEPYVYRHLDWKRPLEWLGETPFVVAEHRGRLVAALACPPDPPGVAWLKVFAASNQVRLDRAWRMLWEATRRELSTQGPLQIAALCSETWMQKLLLGSGFHHTQTVVLLAWDPTQPLPPSRFPLRPRAMTLEDLPQVTALDWACFEPLWRNSHAALQIAFQQAVFATVLEDEHGLVGYQISTPSAQGGHLARLAVHPRAQGRGLGYALVYDLLMRFIQHSSGISPVRVTVNTQADNQASLAVYRRANFMLTGHQYPVYLSRDADDLATHSRK
jgi:ribosomal-protein-alanine N-acetyltransferase